MNLSDNTFVFVVCGPKKHIETLHFSLSYLKHFSSSGIIVVTDSRRNEVPVSHSEIVDISTPQEMDNHQASIWLKTFLHKILPKGPMYCYLDTDIIAVEKDCDKVFGQFITPISFAADHCSMPWFSPYAVNCDCSERYAGENAVLESIISSVVKNPNYPPDYRNPQTRELFRKINNIRKHPFKNLRSVFNVFLAHITGKKRITGELVLDIKNKEWRMGGFTYPFLLAWHRKVTELTGYKFLPRDNVWIKPDGNFVAVHYCNHLADAIEKDLGVDVCPKWQHWNGGVFLFNERSHGFMDIWHEMTMQTFKLPYWKTRDQGALIATAWKSGFESHPLLNREFNFIADYNDCNNEYFYSGNSITVRSNGRKIKPKLIHVYHEFGNKEWALWQKIEKLGAK